MSALLSVPVPFWTFEGGRVPTVWLFELAGFTGALLWSEGGTVVALAFGLLLGEALLATGLLYLAARLVTRALTRVPREQRHLWIAVAVLGLLLLSSFEIYRTPFVAEGRPVNLVGIFG